MRGDEQIAAAPLGDEVLPALFDTVVDRAGTSVVVFDEDLLVRFVNEVTAELWNGPAPSFLGSRLVEVMPEIGAQAEPLIEQAFATQEPVQNDELVWEPAGAPHERRYWMGSYVPFRSRSGDRYVASVHVETTDARRAQERLTRVLDTLPTFVGLTTPDGTLIDANEPALAAGDLRSQDVLGRPFWEAYWFSHDPAVQARLRAAVDQAANGTPSRFDVQVRIAGGDLVTIDFQLVPVIEHGAVTALVPAAMDISARARELSRLEALTTLSHHLNGAMTEDQVARLVVEHAMAVVDAAFVNVALLDADGQRLHLVQSLPEPDMEQRWAIVELDGPVRTPFHDVLEIGRPQVVDDRDRRLRYPEMVEDTERAGLHTTASYPLLDETGAVFGVLGVGWAEQVTIADALRLRLTLLADLCSHALRRAQRTEAQSRLARELQDEVLGDTGGHPGLDVAVTYEPAQSDIGFGGDWYDVIALDDHHTAFVVGDVAGHGIPAAARMTEAKAAIRALVLTTASRADVLAHATITLDHFDSGYVATAAVAWVDAEAGTVAWSLAGHPPPVVRTPTSGTRLLTGVHHPPLGMPFRPRPPDEIGFPPGSLLVLYTDGVVERRDEDIDQGLQRLRALVESLPADCTAEHATQAILRELRPEVSHDDVALVVVRRHA